MSVRKSFLDPSDIPNAVFDLSSTVTGLTAAGSTQGTALALDYTTFQRVTTVAASTGVRLPAATVGARIVVFNKGANSLTVYPATGEAINNGAANAAFSGGVAAQRSCMFVCMVAGTWDSLYSA